MRSALKAAVRWLDDRTGFSAAILPIIEHPVPRAINWWYVLGSATLIAFIFQVITGVSLAFTYVPSPAEAYDTLQFITHQAQLGNLVRGIHYFGASAMVVLITAHMTRVFLMGSYKFPRELNWITGAFLFFLTMAMAFTGQLLRWNQDAYWAIGLAARMVGRVPLAGQWLGEVLIAGQTIGGATLTRFYATHVFLIPALIFGVVGVHLYLLIRHGISEPPEKDKPVRRESYRQEYEQVLRHNGIPFWPYAAWRDAAFALVVGAIVVVLAIMIGAPELGKQADPTDIVADPRPDWYFLWYFALLAVVPRALEDVLLVGLPIVVIAAIVALPLLAPYGERSPSRRPWAVATVLIAAGSIGALVWAGEQAPWSPSFGADNLPAAVTQSLSGSELQGARLFEEKGCIYCHAIGGAGGMRGPDLSGAGARLTRERMTGILLSGRGNMPAFGTVLQPAEVDALLDFLSTRQDR